MGDASEIEGTVRIDPDALFAEGFSVDEVALEVGT